MRLPSHYFDPYPITTAEVTEQRAAAQDTDVSEYGLSNNILEWVQQVRWLRGERFSFNNREYLEAIYLDDSPEAAVAKGRQTEFSEFGVNWLLFNLWKHKGTIGLYMASRQSQTSKFSKLRVRDWAIKASPILDKIAPWKQHTTTELPFTNGSLLYFHSAWGGMEEARSIPADFVVIDESQSIDFSEIDVLRETTAKSKYGKIRALGTGADEGSDWEKHWKRGKQFAWEKQPSGKMRWVEKNKEGLFNSYHVPQTIVPWLNTAKIAAKEQRMTPRRYVTEVLGGWWRGLGKPITEQMMRALFSPDLDFLIPNDINYSRGHLYMGVDWGGGTRAYTVPWIWQCLDPEIPIFRLVYTKRIMDKDLDTQAEKIIRLIEAYKPKKVVMDAGGGPHQVQKIEKRYGYYATKSQYMQRPEQPWPDERELREQLDGENVIRIDRTYIIDVMVDLVQRHYKQGKIKTPRLLIPAADPQNIEFVVDHFTAIEAQPVKTQSGRAYTRYIHDEDQPDDALHAAINAYLAFSIDHKFSVPGYAVTG